MKKVKCIEGDDKKIMKCAPQFLMVTAKQNKFTVNNLKAIAKKYGLRYNKVAETAVPGRALDVIMHKEIFL